MWIVKNVKIVKRTACCCSTALRNLKGFSYALHFYYAINLFGFLITFFGTSPIYGSNGSLRVYR